MIGRPALLAQGHSHQHLFKVTSSDYPKWFYYHWVQYHLPEFQYIAASKATTMGHIQRHHLKEARVNVPDPNVLNEANKIINPLFEKIILNKIESRNLIEIRDTLLPKLMSGQVRVL